MNRIFRLVFNRELGVVQVASELTSSTQGGAGSAEGVRTATLPALRFAMYVALGFVLTLPSFGQAMQGQISGDPNAPGNQRPTVLEAPNGVPLVQISTPSAAGVSRNQYRQMDVGQEGAILNNSRTNVQTQLGGWVQGNPNLATGTAKVILNEVNSASPSHIQGYVEVAGDRAEVIIANPAGLQISGGGFINASRATLTTGRPVLSGGALEGYRVEGSGAIQVSGAGLDASRTDYTDLITRSVQLNAGIWANQLKVTTGANTVSADHSLISKVDGASGPAPKFAIDVSALGGMYANHIALIGTEAGVGVTNAGTIGAQVGGLVVTVDGRLVNTGTLQSQQDAHVDAAGGVANAGMLSAARELTVTTPSDLNNDGGTLNARRLEVNANSLTNRGGAIEQSGTQALSLNAGSLSNRDGGRIGAPELSGSGEGGGSSDGGGTGGGAAGGSGGAVDGGGPDGTGGGSQPGVTPLTDGALRISGALNNDGGRIEAGGIDLMAADGLDNDGGHLGLGTLRVDSGDLRNAGGELTVSGAASLQVNTLNNDAGRLSVAGPLAFDAQRVSNRGGTLQHSGTEATALNVASAFDNTGGTVASNASALALNTSVLVNERGQLLHSGTDGLQVQTGALSGAGGTIATAGAATLNATVADHRGATLSANQVSLTAESLDNRGGQITTTGEDPNVLLVRGALDNGDGGTISSNGDLTLRASTFGNDRGVVQHAGTGAMTISAETLNGTGGTLASNGALSITGQSTNLRDGDTTARRISVDTGTLTNAGGVLTGFGTETLELRARDALDNSGGTIQGNGALLVRAGVLSNAAGTLSAAGSEASAITVDTLLDNSAGALATAGATYVQAGDLTNRGGTLQVSGEAPLAVTVAGRLDNGAHGTIAAGGDMTLSAAVLDNTQGAIEHAGTGALDIIATTLTGTEGTIGSNGSLTLRGETINLRSGTTVAQSIKVDTGDLTTAGGKLTAVGTDVLDLRVRESLDNTAGTLATNGALRLQAGSLTNTDGTITMVGAGASSVRVVNGLENTRGTLAATGDTTVHAGSLTNVGGTVQTAGTSTLQVTVDGRLDNSGDGQIAAGGAANVSGGSLDNRTGTISAGDTLDLSVAQALDNDHGLIAGTNALSLSADTLTNRGGTLVSINDGLVATTVGYTDNAGGTIQAEGDVSVASAGLGNASGAIIGANTRIDTRQQALDNAAGTIASTNGELSIQSGALNNDAGLLQAAAAMAIDTHGQTLTNINAGGTGGLISGGAMALNTGDLDNRRGVVHAQGDLGAIAGTLDNTGGGQFGGAADVLLDAAALRNSGGTVQAGQNLEISVAGDVDNTAGLIVAGAAASISANAIINRDTASDDPSVLLGLQGDSVTLNADRIDNTAGLIAADTHIGVTGTGAGSALDNTDGNVSSAGSIDVAVDAVTNTGGTLLSGTDQSITANYMSGDGRVLSQGDLRIALQQDLVHTGEITANGSADISTAGTLTNHSTIQAGDLTVRGNNIDNTATGTISGGRTHVVASDTVTNRGLIDGIETRIDAGTIDNVGSGRIYGDHIAMGGGTVNNREETLDGVTRAATIAARERLDIGAGTLNNREQALIFSGGSGADALNVGGAIDADGHATGRATVVHNASATIESLGGLTIAATTLKNTNEHFSTVEVQVGGPTDVVYIQPSGDANRYDATNFVWERWSRAGRYRWKDDPAPNETGVLGSSPVPRVGEQTCTGETEDTCSRLPGSDYLPGDPAWAYFGVAEPDPAPVEPVLADYADQASFDEAHAQWDTAHAAWESATDSRYSALDNRIETYNDGFAGDEIRNWTQYEVTRTEYETQVTSSAPGQIRSGGSMWLFGDQILNDKSQIVVGGVLAGDLHNLTNEGAFGTHRVHETGTSQYTYSRWRGGIKRYHEREWESKIAHTPADAITQIELSIAPVGGSGYQVEGRTTGTVGGGSGGSAEVGAGAGQRQITEVATQVGPAEGPSAAYGDSVAAGARPDGANGKNVSDANANAPSVVRTIGVDATVPNSSLFRVGGSAAGYLIETDPQFADYRSWLGSEYLLGLLSTDPNYMHKRLGDGYYEQRLVREQIGQLTGRRFLDGYASDEAQYRALMENGATFAQAWDLRPGVALSAEQMAQLTSDIVWLVEQTVTLPDGTSTTALVPQVYVRVRPGDLSGTGTLISGDVIDVGMKGDLVNSGTIAGRTAVQLTGENLHNLGGRITGDAVSLRANTDINNIGGTIDAGSALVATAGRDINVVTTTRSDAKQAGLSDFSRTNVDRVAGLYVTNPGGTMAVVAGRDANLVGAHVVNAGQGGQTVVAAGRNINLGTVTVSEQENNVRNADNYLRQGHTQEVGTNIHGNGSVLLQAEGDINARAAQVTSEAGSLIALANGDVNITSGQSTANLSEGHKQKHSSALGSTTKTTRDSVEEAWSQGSTFSGNTVAIQATNIHVTGSNVISDEGTTLVAKDKITVDAAQNTRAENHFQQTERSGVFTGGEVGFSIGKQQLGSDADIREVTHTGSTIGSVGGRVDMVAGGHIGIAGSDVIGMSGVGISGKTVTIEHVEDTVDVHETQTAQSGGLHISVKGGAADAVASTYGSLKRAGEVKDDRLKGLYAAQAAQTLYSGGNSPVSAGAIGDQVGNAKDVVNGDRQANAGGMSLRIGVGGSSSKAESESHQTSAQGSTIYSGNGNVSVVAREGDLMVIGSKVEGINTTVAAAGDLILLSAKEASELKEKSTAKSGEIGVTIGSEAGIGVYVSASMAKGKGEGVGTTHAETIIGGNRGTTTFVSGGDTVAQGAQIIGDKVIGRVGGDLLMKSEQDTNDYKRKDTAAGIDAAVGTGGGQVSGYASQSKVDSTYTSVKEQTGVQAGKGGFDIQVDGHTQLDGAAIASAADPSQNTFVTGSLGWTDLKNEAEYKATSVGVSGGGGSGGGGVSPNVAPSQHEKSTSTTKAGIADGTLTVRDGTGGGVSRGVTELEQDGLREIFDEQKVAERMEMGQVAGQVGMHAAGSLAAEMGWEEGSKEKAILHGIVGAGVAALAGGSALDGLTGAAASQVVTVTMQQYLRDNQIDPDSEQGRAMMELGSLAVGAAVGGSSGAATALAGEKYNRQLHIDEAKKLAELKDGKSEAEQQRLNDAMCALTHCSAGVPDNDPNKKALVDSEQRGQAYKPEQEQIRQAGAFNGYTSTDATNDKLLKYDEWISRGGGTAQAIGGAAGAIGATAGAAASSPACTTVVGCLAPAGLLGLAVLSAQDGMEGLNKALAPYQSTQGQRVLDSFDPTTHWGDQNRLAELGIDGATLIAQAAIARLGGKLLTVEPVVPAIKPTTNGAGRVETPDRLLPDNIVGDGLKPTRNFAEGENPNLSVNQGQQNKHVLGTNEYKTASQVTERSPLSPGVNPQELINRYAGTGKSANSVPLGRPGSVERIKTNQVVGTYYENGIPVGPTTNFTIRYAKDGVHIIPARP